ncbi:hypothetical protein EB077_14660 [bacterium]|nr:hypothetical protein [bacterium]
MRRSRLARPIGRRDAKGRICGSLPTLLNRSQERAIRRAWRAGLTRDEAARAAGVSVGLIRQRLADQLSDLPRRGRGRGASRRVTDPTEEEIYGRLTLAIQATWTDEEREAAWKGLRS